MPRYYRRRTRKPSYRYGVIGKKGFGQFKKTFAGGFKSVWSMAKEALSMAKSIKSVINVERKYVDTKPGTTNITATPGGAYSICLNGSALGDGESQRNGHSVRAQSIGFSFDTQFSSGGNSLQKIRWMLVQFPKADGAAPDTTHMFKDDTDFASMKNLDYPFEARILRQGFTTLDAERTPARHWRVSMPIRFREVFEGDGDTYEDISRNSLWFYIWGDQTVDHYPVLTNFESRYRYVDN